MPSNLQLPAEDKTCITASAKWKVLALILIVFIVFSQDFFPQQPLQMNGTFNHLMHK
jgi:hypothetical protein